MKNYVEEEWFDAYLQNNLSAQEIIEFEKKLASDAQFQQNFVLYKDVSEVLENRFSKDRKEFVDTVKQIGSTYHTSGKKLGKTIRLRPWHYAVAASIVLLIGLFLFNESGTPMYSDYAPSYEISLSVRGESEASIKNAEKAFNEKDFLGAITQFNKILEDDPDNIEVNYYKAVAFIEVEQYAEADKLLASIAKGNSAFVNKAKWMASLSKLKQGDYKGTKELLREIDSDSEYYSKAQKLLKQLR